MRRDTRAVRFALINVEVASLTFSKHHGGVILKLDDETNVESLQPVAERLRNTGFKVKVMKKVYAGKLLYCLLVKKEEV